MRIGVASEVVAIVVLAGALVLACADARAAQQGGAQPPAAPATPNATQGQTAKPDGVEAKPTETPSAPAAGDTTETTLPESKPVALVELTKEGFEVRGTEFIPAEAVTRQSGKVSSDAIVVTLQKSTATAVCFYTLKAYVSKKLTTIPACTVHR